MLMTIDGPPDLPEYLFNVQFTAAYFTLTVHLCINSDDDDDALDAAAELMRDYYDFDVVNISLVAIEIERV